MVDFSRHNRLDGTAAVASASGEVGTAGCLVHAGSDAVCILGSAHVFVAAASTGDAHIYQPPALHANSSPVAVLWDASVADRTGGTSNLLDAAVAPLVAGVPYDPNIGGLGAPTQFDDPVANSTVRIHGAGSAAQTSGQILVLSETTPVTYDDGSMAWFQGVVRCQRFSLPGDSGAAVLDQNGRVVGIHLCGNDQYSWFCPIRPALQRWPLTLVERAGVA